MRLPAGRQGRRMSEGSKKYSSGIEEEVKRRKEVRRQQKFGEELVTQSQKFKEGGRNMKKIQFFSGLMVTVFLLAGFSAA